MNTQCTCLNCKTFDKKVQVRSAKRNLRKLKTYIHVNRLRLTSNRNETTNLPVIAVRRGRSGKPEYYNRVRIAGPSEVVYDPVNPLCIGAQVWVEVEPGVPVVMVEDPETGS